MRLQGRLVSFHIFHFSKLVLLFFSSFLSWFAAATSSFHQHHTRTQHTAGPPRPQIRLSRIVAEVAGKPVQTAWRKPIEIGISFFYSTRESKASVLLHYSTHLEFFTCRLFRRKNITPLFSILICVKVNVPFGFFFFFFQTLLNKNPIKKPQAHFCCIFAFGVLRRKEEG